MPPMPPEESKISPDGKWEAFIKNFNVWLRSKDNKDQKEEFPLSWEGNEGDYYTLLSLTWPRTQKSWRPARSGPVISGSSNILNPRPRISFGRNTILSNTPSRETSWTFAARLNEVMYHSISMVKTPSEMLSRMAPAGAPRSEALFLEGKVR